MSPGHAELGGGNQGAGVEQGRLGIQGNHHPLPPEQNALMDMAPPNPHTLLFEILSLLVEMLALPEAALEEITR